MTSNEDKSPPPSEEEADTAQADEESDVSESAEAAATTEDESQTNKTERSTSKFKSSIGPGSDKSSSKAKPKSKGAEHHHKHKNKPKSKGNLATKTKRVKSKETHHKGSTKNSKKKSGSKKGSKAVSAHSVKSAKPAGATHASSTRPKSKSKGSKKSSNANGGKAVPVQARKIKPIDGKSKSGGRGKINAKLGHKTEGGGKSQRKGNCNKETSAADLASQILTSVKAKSKAEPTGSSSSASSVASEKSKTSPSSVPKPKSKPKMKSTKTRKSSGKTQKPSAPKGKKVAAPKGKEPGKGGGSSKSTTGDADNAMERLKMDPKTAQVIEQLLIMLKQQQQTSTSKDEAAKSGQSTDALPMSNDEMEELNDELTDLNTSIQTLRNSYGSIVRSLVNMQKRRAKKIALGPVTAGHEGAPDELGKTGGATGGSNTDAPTLASLCTRVAIDYDTKYSMDRFLDGGMRDSAFEELFKEVNEINSAMAPFRVLFNGEGYFQREAYLKQEELKLGRDQYNDLLKVFKGLHKAVTAILKAYNTDLLDMFRLNSTAS